MHSVHPKTYYISGKLGFLSFVSCNVNSRFYKIIKDELVQYIFPWIRCEIKTNGIFLLLECFVFFFISPPFPPKIISVTEENIPEEEYRSRILPVCGYM